MEYKIENADVFTPITVSITLKTKDEVSAFRYCIGKTNCRDLPTSVDLYNDLQKILTLK